MADEEQNNVVEETDELGVPYKNRYMEAERKREKAEQERDEAQARLNTVSSPTVIQVEEDEWTKQQREIAKQESLKVLQSETQATDSMRSILDRMEVKNPHIKKYRGMIESRLRGMSSDLRSNPGSVELIADSVVGKNWEEITRDNKVSTNRQQDDGRRLVSEVLTPTPSSNGHQKVELSEDEINYGEQHRLFDKGFTSEEVRDMFNKRKAKNVAK